MERRDVQRLSRRDFLRGATFAAAAGFVTACAPAAGGPAAGTASEGGAAAPSADEDITLQYWVNWGGSYGIQTWDVLKESDKYAEMMGDVKIEVLPSAGDEKILTSVAAGTPPDGASNVQYLDFMARGVLVPIDDWIAQSSLIQEDKFLEGTWKDGGFEGVMYGVPANEGFLRYALNYNAEHVSEAGLDPDSPPKTWDELWDWHLALTEFDDAGNLIKIGLDPYDAMGGNLAIQDGFFPAVSWGFEWFNADTGEFNLDNEMMIDAFETMGAYYKQIGPDNMAGMRQVEGQGMWGGSYNSEVQSVMIDGYWRPGGTNIQKPEVGQHNRATWAPVPDHRKDVNPQGTGGHYIIIYKDSTHKEEMFRIGEFLNTQEALDIIFDNVGWLPGQTEYLATTDSNRYPGLQFYFDSIETATEWSSPARCPITAFARAQFNELRENQYRGDITASEAAAEFQKRCDEEYVAAGFA